MEMVRDYHVTITVCVTAPEFATDGEVYEFVAELVDTGFTEGVVAPHGEAYDEDAVEE